MKVPSKNTNIFKRIQIMRGRPVLRRFKIIISHPSKFIYAILGPIFSTQIKGIPTIFQKILRFTWKLGSKLIWVYWLQKSGSFGARISHPRVWHRVKNRVFFEILYFFVLKNGILGNASVWIYVWNLNEIIWYW